MNKIIYLDSAATYQKPVAVVDAQVDFLRNHYANSGRGVCERSVWVDDMLVRTRTRVAEFMCATGPENIVFTSGTTDSMNQISHMLNLTADSIVAVSDLDHHSARLPFVMTGAKIITCPLDENFNIDENNVPYADVLILTAMSNVMGQAQNVAGIVARAREKNRDVIVVVDAAQFVVHDKIDVRAWDADFVCWSAHKIGADTGLGIMYMKNPEIWKPVKFGGGMVNRISGEEVLYSCTPDVFEAGTLPLTQISGLSVAIDSLEQNRPNLELLRYAYDELSKFPRVKILTGRGAAILTFVVDGIHVLDFGVMMGTHGICLRVGNMCATWIHRLLGITASIRISIGGYNTIDDINQALTYIKDIVK